MLDHFAIDTYRRDLERRRSAEIAADSLADMATAGLPTRRARLAALLRALAARVDPEHAAPAALARGRLVLE